MPGMISILLILMLAAEIWLVGYVNRGGEGGPGARKAQGWLCFLVFLTFCAIIHFLG